MTGRDYIAGEAVYRYPDAGDDLPPTGAKVLILTDGGVCIIGQWRGDGGFTAWAPLPRRDADKEAMLKNS